MLDDDDDFDDDNSDGVSVGDGDSLAMMALLPTGRADSSGPWLPLVSSGTVVAGSADSSGPRALGGVVFSFVLSLSFCCCCCCSVIVAVIIVVARPLSSGRVASNGCVRTTDDEIVSAHGRGDVVCHR